MKIVVKSKYNVLGDDSLNEQLDYTPDIYTLIDEEGVEQEFELLDVLEINDSKYFALLPYFENPEEHLEQDGALVVLKQQIIDGEEMMASIDDEEEYLEIGNIFMERLSEIFDNDNTDSIQD